MCYTYFLRFFDSVNIIFLNSNFNNLEVALENKIQFNTRDVVLDTLVEGGVYSFYTSSQNIEVSSAFPNAKYIMAIGGRRSGSSYLCTASVDGGHLRCASPYAGVYKVIIVGFY